MATQITSDKVQINASNEEVFAYLNDFNNIKELLPQDKISDWQATQDDCSFKIQNAAIIPLVKDSTEEFTQINVVSGDKAPFPFTLKIYIKDIGDGKTEGYLDFNGEINAFLRMMVVTPLTNLFNYMAKKLQEKFA
jgi:carbon monoxide dehydrogenase subunit G